MARELDINIVVVDGEAKQKLADLDTSLDTLETGSQSAAAEVSNLDQSMGRFNVTAAESKLQLSQATTYAQGLGVATEGIGSAMATTAGALTVGLAAFAATSMAMKSLIDAAREANTAIGPETRQTLDQASHAYALLGDAVGRVAMGIKTDLVTGFAALIDREGEYISTANTAVAETLRMVAGIDQLTAAQYRNANAPRVAGVNDNGVGGALGAMNASFAARGGANAVLDATAAGAAAEAMAKLAAQIGVTAAEYEKYVQSQSVVAEKTRDAARASAEAEQAAAALARQLAIVENTAELTRIRVVGLGEALLSIGTTVKVPLLDPLVESLRRADEEFKKSMQSDFDFQVANDKRNAALGATTATTDDLTKSVSGGDEAMKRMTQAATGLAQGLGAVQQAALAAMSPLDRLNEAHAQMLAAGPWANPTLALTPGGSAGRPGLGMLPHFAEGGPVMKDGPIYAHAGEYVVPKDNPVGGTTITNQITIQGNVDSRATADRLAEQVAARVLAKVGNLSRVSRGRN